MVNKPEKQILVVYTVLIIALLAVFGQVCKFGFVNIDDVVYVTENNFVRSGITLNGLYWAFMTTYGEFWHPLTWLSLMIDSHVHGLNAAGFHATNLILHILSTLLLFRLFYRVTGTIWPSAFVAALFGLHPLHVESVAWIAERKDVLSAFFAMLTLNLYAHYIQKPDAKKYLLVLVCFLCALMSKSIVVTLPVIMILLDYWPLGRFASRNDNPLLWQLKEKTPFFVLSAIFSAGTFLAQQNPTTKYFSFGARAANATVSFITYLEKTLWPFDLAVFYPFPDNLPPWQVAGAAILIIAISIAVIAIAKRVPCLFVGWFWYVITLLPVIGIVQVGKQAMADRYTYLPLIGAGIGLAWGVPLMLRHESIRKKILFPLGVLFIFIMSLITWKQCGYWRNSMELFNHALKVTENNYVAHNDLGLALFAEGKTEEAIDHYNRAIGIMPDHMIIYQNRGDAYARLGRYQNAIEDYTEAIRLKPDCAAFHSKRGAVYLSQGNKISGCRDAQKACELGNCAIWEASRSRGDCPK